MSVGTVTCTVLRQGLTYGTFWPGALAQPDMSERRTENLLYGNTYYLCTTQIAKVTFLKKRIIYCTVLSIVLYVLLGHKSQKSYIPGKKISAPKI
jgi:hypothetical protein